VRRSIAGELFKSDTGVNMVHVPYRGSAPALTDMLSGQVQVYFSPIGSALEYIRTGRLRALAVTAASRSGVLPEGEFVPGYEASSWNGLGAPRGTPVEIIEQLNAGIKAALADRQFKARVADLGGVTKPMSPANFRNFIVAETEKWANVTPSSCAKSMMICRSSHRWHSIFACRANRTRLTLGACSANATSDAR